MTPPYITILQFIVSRLGIGLGGKKHMIRTSIKKRTEKVFMARPYRPRLKRRFNSGFWRKRIRQTLEIETMYEEMRAQTPMEVILL
jgi:hypothetical protein